LWMLLAFRIELSGLVMIGGVSFFLKNTKPI
jgi:hypothetical protein